MSGRSFALGLGTVLLWAIVAADTASAQGTEHVVEVSVGGGVMGGSDLGEQPAELRTPGGTMRLFDSASTLGTAASIEVRVGVPLTRRITLEARYGFSRPELRTSITRDAEGAPDTTLAMAVDQHLFDGGVVVRVGEVRPSGVTPFVAVGAGYLRHLDEEQALAADGRALYAGGGIEHWFRERGRGAVRAAAIRVDVRFYFIAGGIVPDDDWRPQGSVSGSLVLGF